MYIWASKMEGGHFEQICLDYGFFEGNFVRCLQRMVNLFNELLLAFEVRAFIFYYIIIFNYIFFFLNYVYVCIYVYFYFHFHSHMNFLLLMQLTNWPEWVNCVQRCKEEFEYGILLVGSIYI
jgi:hypothetical protein